jgi:excinuclease ABC subunit B
MFKLFSDFKMSGDQPAAVEKLKAGLLNGRQYQTLLGVTGSGKTFTLANIIDKTERPVLLISHNKTLAAQLYSEFKAFFPQNAVEFFISYYDYYLPESYIPQTDTYIAKDASINENIERLRLSTTSSLMERRDVIVIASVSCIYGLGSPADYEGMCVALKIGDSIKRNEFLKKLVAIQYERNDTAPEQGQFRVRGDSVDVFLPQRSEFIKVEFWGDQVESLARCDIITGKIKEKPAKAVFFPCKHFVMPQERIENSINSIFSEMRERVAYFEKNGLLVEAQRLYQRVNYDMEMLKEIGYCSGIENYSSHLSARPSGSRPSCLIDFFPDDFLTIIDESHASMPQLNAMYKADRSRKQTLVDHGFRLPSAMDNRPLQFDEFKQLTNTTIFVSATPGVYEMELSGEPVELVVRPTGLLDPEIFIRPLDGQIDDVMAEIRICAEKHERILVTTLTKKNSERLADYLKDLGLKPRE